MTPSDWWAQPYQLIRHVLHDVFNDREPVLRPADLINGALTGRRRTRIATKDRRTIKAARKQRNRK